MVGPTAAVFLSLAYGPTVLLAYLVWVMSTRTVAGTLIGLQRRRFSPYFPILLYYMQVVGSVLKIHVSFRINRQSWTRQNISSGEAGSPLRVRCQRYVSTTMQTVTAGYFCLVVGLATGFLSWPDQVTVESFTWAVAPDAETKYAVLYPMPGQGFDGTIGAPYRLGNFAYQVTAVGAVRQQAEWVADLARDVMLGGLTVSGRRIHVVHVAHGDVQRDDTVTPPLFYAWDRYLLRSS